MTSTPFQNRPPDAPRLTSYDESHLDDYLRLLDAAAEGADWRETALPIFGIDPITEPDRAQAIHCSHLERARWMTEVGYAYLLGQRFH